MSENEDRVEPREAGMNETPGGAPSVVDRATFQAELDALRVREKAHTREGDAIAAARRRLPMVEVDANLALIGPDGPVTLLDAFEGRRQLIAYYFMWNPGRPADEQCEGCTFYTSQVVELSCLHSRDITFAGFCQGSLRRECPLPRLYGLGRAVVLRSEPLSTHFWSGAKSACSTSCAMCGTATASTRPTGRSAVAWRRWTTATRSWISPSTDARSRGRTRCPAGHSNAPACGPTAGHPTGHQ